MPDDETWAFQSRPEQSASTESFGAGQPQDFGAPTQGYGAPVPQTPAGDPHAEYHRQAAAHFSAAPPNPPIGEVPPAQQQVAPPTNPYAPQQDPQGFQPQGPAARQPTQPGPVDYPTGYVPAAPVSAAPQQPYFAAYAQPEGLSYPQRLMARGARGELIRAPGFRNALGHNPDNFVFVLYGGAFLLTLLLNFLTPSGWVGSGTYYTSSFFVGLLISVLWLGVAYVLLAVGTRVAHQFVAFGIGLVGALVSLAGAWGAGSALSVNRQFAAILGTSLAPSGLLVFSLIVNLGFAGLFGYLGLQVQQGIARFSRPPQ